MFFAGAVALAGFLGYGAAQLEVEPPYHQTVIEQVYERHHRFVTTATLYNESDPVVLLQGDFECLPNAMDAEVRFSPESGVSPDQAVAFNERFTVRCNAAGAPELVAATRFSVVAAATGLYDNQVRIY